MEDLIHSVDGAIVAIAATAFRSVDFVEYEIFDVGVHPLAAAVCSDGAAVHIDSLDLAVVHRHSFVPADSAGVPVASSG